MNVSSVSTKSTSFGEVKGKSLLLGCLTWKIQPQSKSVELTFMKF